MFKKSVLVAGIALAVSATAQADYRWEIDGASSHNSIDNFAIGGSFFLDSVDTSKGPLSEAAFLDHASNISVVFGIFDGLDDDATKIDGRYVLDA